MSWNLGQKCCSECIVWLAWFWLLQMTHTIWATQQYEGLSSTLGKSCEAWKRNAGVNALSNWGMKLNIQLYMAPHHQVNSIISLYKTVLSTPSLAPVRWISCGSQIYRRLRNKIKCLSFGTILEVHLQTHNITSEASESLYVVVACYNRSAH